MSDQVTAANLLITVGLVGKSVAMHQYNEVLFIKFSSQRVTKHERLFVFFIFFFLSLAFASRYAMRQTTWHV